MKEEERVVYFQSGASLDCIKNLFEYLKTLKKKITGTLSESDLTGRLNTGTGLFTFKLGRNLLGNPGFDYMVIRPERLSDGRLGEPCELSSIENNIAAYLDQEQGHRNL